MIHVNGNNQEFVDETVASLLERLNIEPRGIAVAISGEIIRRSDWMTTKISDNSSVEIVTAAAGG
jgi:sulfur carrier protein